MSPVLLGRSKEPPSARSALQFPAAEPGGGWGEGAYPRFSPGVADDPVLRAVADTPAGHRNDVVYVGLVVVLSIDASRVVDHLLRRHDTAAERKHLNQHSGGKNSPPLQTVPWTQPGSCIGTTLPELLSLTRVRARVRTLHPRYDPTSHAQTGKSAPGRGWGGDGDTDSGPCAQLAAGSGSSPDGAVGVDFCHHLLPPGEGAIVADFPEGVVLDGMALFEFSTGSTLVKLVALCGTAREVGVRRAPRGPANQEARAHALSTLN